MEREADPPDSSVDGGNLEPGTRNAPFPEHVVVNVKRGMEKEKIAVMAAFGWTLVDEADSELTESPIPPSASGEEASLYFLRRPDLPFLDLLRRLEEEYQSLSETSASGPGVWIILAIVVIPCALWVLLAEGDVFLIALFAAAFGIAWTLVSDRSLAAKGRVSARKEEIISKGKELLSQQ
jgi:hypothetical protein